MHIKLGSFAPCSPPSCHVMFLMQRVCTGQLHVNLTQTTVVREEAVSAEEAPS